MCVKNSKSGTDIIHMLKIVFCEECLSKADIYLWIKYFNDGREYVKDDPRSGQPAMMTWSVR